VADLDRAQLRVPPHSLEAEQSVLGGLLLDNTMLDAALEHIQAGDFYAQDHAAIFGAIQVLAQAGKPADVITVFEALRESKGPGKDVVLSYLNDLAHGVASGSTVRAYAAIVAQRSLRRRLIRLGNDLVSAAYGGGATDAELPAVLDRLQQGLADIAAGRQENAPRLMRELLPAWLDDLSARAEGITDAIPLGLSGVDRVLAGGARRGDLIVLAARPSMGKSALTLGITRAVAQLGPVLVCSLEDSTNMLISRHVSSAGRTPLQHVRLPQHAPQSMWEQIAEAAHTLSGLPIWLDDSAGLSLQDIVGKAKHVKAKAGGLVMVVVDYLQLMDDEGETRSNELANITRGLKNMAKRLGCVVVLLSQLNREADKTTAPPRLDHLAESGAIEQAADIIGLLWRERRRNPRPGNESTAQIEFAKNKNGATDTVHLWFDGKTQRFEDLAHGAEGQ